MTAAQLSLVIAGLLAANLPFVTQRCFAGILFLRRDKPFWLRLLELFCLYILLGVMSRLFEGAAYGNPYPQDWAFYAITACLFLVFAYPGFVYRYLWLRRKHA